MQNVSSSNSQKANVPKLRFPGFRDEWNSARLDEFCEVNPKTAELPDEFYYIDLESVVSGMLDKEMVVKKEEAPSRAQRLLSKDDVLFQMVRPYQKNNYLFIDEKHLPSVASTGYAQLRTSNNAFFLYQLINTQTFTDEVLVRCTGSSYPAINSNDMKEIDICYPTISEQSKIAEFLFKLDNRIEKQRMLIENLKLYKRGVLNKLFSNSDGMEKYSLGKLCNITTGKLDANAMEKNGAYRFYTCAKEFYLINTYAFDTDALLVSGNGANVGYIHHYCGKFNAYQRTYVLDGFDSSNIIYVKYYLESKLKERIENEKKAGNTPYIVLSTLSEMPIFVPDEKKQSCRASFLTKLDKLITKAEYTLESLANMKRGVLQQMFI